MNSCIYRYINTGKCCCIKTKQKYCKLHINNRNIIYEIIDKAIDNKYIITENDIYKIYSYIYNNKEIYVKELIFKTFLKIIYKKYNRLINIYPYLLKNEYNIIDIINFIYNINKKTYEINKEECKIKLIQKKIRYFLIKDHIYNNKYKNKIINEVDPFTFDNINDINIIERFIYFDGNNYYCFKAIELLYFIENKCNNWNPYTKKEFENKIIRNLKIFIKHFNLFNNNNYDWNTNIQAFTEVSQSLEKIGFYNNTEWFLKLTSKQIKNIIRLFKIISANDIISNNYFNENNINNNTIFFDFARETIKLFEDGNSNFLLCCNYMKALGAYSNDFYNNLPEWMNDIESPIQIINNNNTTNLFHRIINNIDIIYLINIIETNDE